MWPNPLLLEWPESVASSQYFGSYIIGLPLECLKGSVTSLTAARARARTAVAPFGHKRRFYVIPADEGARIHTVKEGINFLPQNIAACITEWAMCDFSDRVDWRIAQPRISVHDSILVNCRNEHTEEVGALLKQCLEDAPKHAIGWDFPFKAELSIGPNWGDLHETA